MYIVVTLSQQISAEGQTSSVFVETALDSFSLRKKVFEINNLEGGNDYFGSQFQRFQYGVLMFSEFGLSHQA